MTRVVFPDANLVVTRRHGMMPEEVAAQCAAKVISVADSTDPVLKQQAYAYRDEITKVIAYYMREALRADRDRVAHELVEAGHPVLAQQVRNL